MPDLIEWQIAILVCDPFTEVGPSLQPEAMDASLIRLQDAYPGDIWCPCDRLAQSTTG